MLKKGQPQTIKGPAFILWLWLALLIPTNLCCAQSSKSEVEEEIVTFRETRFRVVRIAPARLQLFSKISDPHISIRLVGNRVRKSGRKLIFATNAGMYLKDFSPQGLHIEDGKEITPLNLRPGAPISLNGKKITPNFYLKPNGVFLVTTKDTAAVIESTRFSTSEIDVRLATQSGPLLIHEGRIHPAFREGSDSRKHRNGVGIDKSGYAVFAITDDAETVNFFDFAKLFEHLGCRNALYLDGVISVMSVNPIAGREPVGSLGGVLAVAE